MLLALSVLLAALASRPLRGDEAEPLDPRRPPAIETSGVPVVPPELFERLNQYQNVRSAGFEGWSPDGQGMLVGTRFGNSSQLHRVGEPGARREQITFFEEPVSGRFVPQQPQRVLLSMSRGGDENFQLYLLELDSGRSRLLTDGNSRNRLGPVRRDGSQMIVHSTLRNGRDTDLYLASPDDAESPELIFETDGEFWFAVDWSPAGDQLLLVRYVSINESYPALFDVAQRTLTPLPLPGEGTSAVGSGAFAPDGQSIYLTSDARSEFLELARLDLTTHSYQWLTSDIPWDVDEIEVEPASGRVAFTVNEDGAGRLYLLDGDQRRPLELPLGIVSSLEFSPDGARLGFTLARPDAPADAYSIRLADGRLERWTYSEVGGLNPAAFVVPERVRYPSFDGREIPAYYFRPRGASAAEPAAVLVQIHGGPESQYKPYFAGLAQFLVGEMGIALVAPNVRGSSGYGKTYLQLDNGPLREDSVRDIGGLLDWIDQQPELDGSRVAVMGGSYGGYMVLASLVHFGERIRAGVDIVGIANFITFLENTSPYRQDLRRAEYGDERDPEMRAVFERISPSNNVDRIRSALLVAHGTNDPRVPFSEAQQIADRVRASGRDVWTVYANNEGHGFAKKDNRDYVTAVEVLFLLEHLSR